MESTQIIEIMDFMDILDFLNYYKLKFKEVMQSIAILEIEKFMQVVNYASTFHDFWKYIVCDFDKFHSSRISNNFLDNSFKTIQIPILS